MKQIVTCFALALLTLQACKQNPTENPTKSENTMDIKLSGETETQAIVNPPMVPAPIGDRAAKKVVVHLEATEEVGELADGVTLSTRRFTVVLQTYPGQSLSIHPTACRDLNRLSNTIPSFYMKAS